MGTGTWRNVAACPSFLPSARFFVLLPRDCIAVTFHLYCCDFRSGSPLGLRLRSGVPVTFRIDVYEMQTHSTAGASGARKSESLASHEELCTSPEQ